MINLIGEYEGNMDAKGRLMLPGAFKKQLQSILSQAFIIKKGTYNACLEMYPMEEFNKLMGQIRKLNPMLPKDQAVIRKFVNGAKTAELDSNSRFLLPKDLIDYAGIDKIVIMAAAVNKIEIWDKKKYEQVLNDPSVDFASLAEEVMGKLNNSEGNDVP